jgi:transposase
MLIYSRVNGAFSPINALSRTHLANFKTTSKEFNATLDCYLEQIVNYFIYRHSSGFVEELNNKIKVIKRRCYGILNAEHLFQRIFLDISERSAFDL